MKGKLSFPATFAITGALVASVAAFCVVSAFARADVNNGRTLFDQTCAGCHTIDPAPAHGPGGPTLFGVAGRKAGTVDGWDFSPALRASGVVWTEDNLDKWLTDPDTFVSGSQMPMKLPEKADREDVIGYLKTLTAKK